MRRVRAIVTGRVQGVSYRASTASEATRLGIAGWVRNRSDGSVELEAEGPDEHIAALLRWCEYGPPAARVARVAVEELAPTGAEREFKISRDQ
ncbi:MAG: acylphosphatase [Myxococcales bacterium]|nr:acylphosphatase [Myxococcales bacterium]